MPAYVIFDVEIRDLQQYQSFMLGVKPALEAAGARYLARGGAHKVYEGDWQPRRIVLLEFPSVAAWEALTQARPTRDLKRSGTLAVLPAWSASKASTRRQVGSALRDLP